MNKKSNFEISPDANITGAVKLIRTGGGQIKIGEGTYFNGGVIRAQSANVIIGKYCRISYDVLFLTNYGSHFLMSDDGKIRCGPIIVNDNVWIGWGAKIRGNVTLGDFAVIGMGTVVTRNVKPFHMVVGNPAKDIGLRPDTEKIISLIKEQCGESSGEPFEVLTKFKQQGYTFAEAGQNPENGAVFFVAPKGKKLQYTNEFLVWGKLLKK